MLSIVIGLMLLLWAMPSPQTPKFWQGIELFSSSWWQINIPHFNSYVPPPKCFPQSVTHSLEMPARSSLKMEKHAGWHQQTGTAGVRFHPKDSLVDHAGPCSPGQAVGPVVTQEGMPLTSGGHARELLSTCQQVTSYGNQTRANLRTFCVTAYLDLGLSFESLSFTFAWA